jgi:outer membrane protein
MKQFSSILNIVLIIAVAVLYYLHFSQHKTPISKANNKQPVDTSLHAQSGQIAYVDLDSFYNNVTQIKAQKSLLDAEQKSIQQQYENEYKELENLRNNFLKKGASITQQEEEDFRNKLMAAQQQIEGKKQAGIQQLSEKNATMMLETQGKLKKFIAEFNKDKKYRYILAVGNGWDYLFYKDSTQNITNEIVEGLNAEMNKKAKL